MTSRAQHPASAPADDVRAAFRRHAAGVAIITVPAGPDADTHDGPTGLTVTSLSSVSLRPPMISFNIARTSSSWPALSRAQVIGVHILGVQNREVAARFARRGVDRFAPPTRWAPGPFNVPLLTDDGMVWLIAVIEQQVDVGDHAVVIARVVQVGDGHLGGGSRPLIYHDGRFNLIETLNKEDTAMPVPFDDDPSLIAYAHPERLVTTDWLQKHAGEPGLVVVESDEDVLLYETGHIPGSIKIDWVTDLNDPVTRDYLDGAGFAALLTAKGISRDDTVVIYGDKNNWWAAYALWVFTLFGHDDVRLLDGGRGAWIAEGRAITTEAPAPVTANAKEPYPVVERVDAPIRAFKDDVLGHLGRPMVDVRSLPEYTGEKLHIPEYPQEGVLRGGHIPGAVSVPWARAAAQDGRFKGRAELEAIYQGEQGLSPSDDVIAYCRIGERSSHTWFVLTHLLGFSTVRNYDGSWTEWGNAVRVPIVKGEAPGDVPAA